MIPYRNDLPAHLHVGVLLDAQLEDLLVQDFLALFVKVLGDVIRRRSDVRLEQGAVPGERKRERKDCVSVNMGRMGRRGGCALALTW